MIILVFYNLFFIVLETIHICKKNTKVTKSVDEIWEHSNITKKKSDRARNKSSRTIGQVSSVIYTPSGLHFGWLDSIGNPPHPSKVDREVYVGHSL